MTEHRPLPQVLKRVRTETVIHTAAAIVFVAIVLITGRIGVLSGIPLFLLVAGLRRRARLSVVAEGGDAKGVVSGSLNRWPISSARVIANEQARLSAELDASERLSKPLGP